MCVEGKRYNQITEQPVNTTGYRNVVVLVKNLNKLFLCDF